MEERLRRSEAVLFNAMALNTAGRDVIEVRRSRVAHWRLRGLSAREIAAQLAVEELVNPRTGAPWDHVTVFNDLRALTQTWRAEALGDTAPLKSRLWAELRAARRRAWAQEDLITVLRGIKLEAELLGLNEPDRVDVEVRVRGLALARGLDPEAAVDEVRRILDESSRS